MDIENFRRNAHGLVDWMADYLNNIEHDKNIYKSCNSPWQSVHINVDGTLFRPASGWGRKNPD